MSWAGQAREPDLAGLSRVRGEVRELAPELIALRRHFHRYPERGFEEVRTAARIVEELRACGGYAIRTEVAKTGIVADLTGEAGSGPTVMLRADMDALRVQEENPHLEYASTHPGVMHACGHDGHMAMLLGVAKILARHRDRIRGRVRLIFQPAEESPGGAEPMIAEGALQDPRPDVAFGLHLWSKLPTGYAATRPGPMMAYTEELYLRVHGKGGHGAYPHEGVDAIVAAAQLVVALQSIVSRNVDPIQSAVLTIGKIAGGSVMNALAESVTLDGTQRTFLPEIRELCMRRVAEVAAGIDTALGTSTEVEYVPRYPALVNDPEKTEFAAGVVEALLGEGHVQRDFLSMGGEDMGFYLREVPGCFLFLGAGNPEKQADAPHHNPHFNFDEDALQLGVEILLRLTERFVGGS
ncbi:MAG: amidohydrolase [Candidatus Eisenbacteria sp.]|nr:amidohydrolase [Candidatus Eisenbacteria bacterium]